jgi:hypothetical protein
MVTRIAYSSAIAAQQEFLVWITLTHPQMRPTMKRHTATPPAEPSEAEIQHAAYMLWIENGRPEGRDLEHWLAAREMLCHRHGRDSHTRRPAPELLSAHR